MSQELSKILSIELENAAHGDSFCVVKPAQIAIVCARLKSEFGFDCLSNLTGRDTGAHFEVNYDLFSYETGKSLTLKVKLERESLAVPSVCEIWNSANWFEREAYDLVGITFTGHPDLRRIMLPADWVGHPLRKDYVECDEYRGMKTTR